MAVITPTPKTQFIDLEGAPLAGGKLYTYTAGTTTPQATYTDSTGATPNSNPVILDERGEANVWLGESTYKFKLCDANDTEIWTVDYISAPTAALSPVLSGNVTISTDSSGPALKITQTGTGDVLRVQDSVDPDTTPFVINASGYVGIGTAAPANALDIAGGTAQISSSTGTSRSLIYADASNSYYTAEADRALILQTNATPRVYVSSAGVGVGVASPTVALDVTGSVTASAAVTAGTTVTAGTSIASGTTITAGSSLTTTTSATIGTTLSADTIQGKTSANTLTLAGISITSSQIPASSRLITATSVVATNTSATSYTVTGIPSWVRRVTIIVRGVNTSSTSPILIQAGTSGGIVSTGYLSTSFFGPSASQTSNSTAGFVIDKSAASLAISGRMIIELLDSSANSYVSTHVAKVATNAVVTGGGDVALSSVLTQIKLTTANGTDTFSAGSLVVTYE